MSQKNKHPIGKIRVRHPAFSRKMTKTGALLPSHCL